MMLTLICGIPNAGKTTYSQQYEHVIHLDRMPSPMFRDKYTECIRQASLREGDVCVEGMFTRREQREQLIKACENQSPKVCIWLDTPLDECVKREESFRKRSVHMVRHHHQQFEPPTLDEGWNEIVIK